MQPQAQENPWGFSHYWTVALLSLTPPLDLTLVGDPGHPRMADLLAAVNRHYLPERRLVRKDPADCAVLEDLAPPVRTYGPQGEAPVAYLCHNFTCEPAVHDPEELSRRLAQLTGG